MASRRKPLSAKSENGDNSVTSDRPNSQDSKATADEVVPKQAWYKGQFQTLRKAGDIDRDIYPYPNFKLSSRNPDCLIIIVVLLFGFIALWHGLY